MAAGRVATPLTLASASPRRRELLALVCADFAVVPSGIEERLGPGDVAAEVAALALAKAERVAARGGGVVLGADTVVAIDGLTLGKPMTAAEAAAMLGRLRGRAHAVLTGVALLDAGSGRRATVVVQSQVVMARYTDADIETYVASGEPFDKAGSYGIQGHGGQLVVGLVGSYTNVIGLPLAETRALLVDFGVPVRGEAPLSGRR